MLGVVLIILYAQEETFAAKLLSTKLFVGAGLISYSAYLWHQPLFAFARVRLIGEISVALTLTLCVFTVVLAALSWKFIEQPFRRRRGIVTKTSIIFSSMFIMAFALSTLGFVGHLSGGFPMRFDQNIRAMLSVSKDENPYHRKCHLGDQRNTFAHPLEGCKDFFINGKADVIFIGDSQSDAISYKIQNLLKRKAVGSYAVSYGGCVGLPGLYLVDRDSAHKCAEYNQSMLRFAKEAGIKTLVITSRFPLYLDGTRFDNKEGGVERGRRTFVDLVQFRNKRLAFDSEIRRKRVKAYYREALENLLKEFNVVLVYPIPEAGWDVPSYLAKVSMLEVSGAKFSTSLRIYNSRNADVFDAFDGIASRRLFRVLPKNVFCSDESERCFFSDSSKVFYKDSDHLSGYGAELIAPQIVEAINRSIVSLQ